jgi:RNA polymerase sigma-70 factor (ECF subfamily)
VVLAAESADTCQAADALGKLCQTYWYPLYAYVRRCGRSPEDAQDLTQEFFTRLIAKHYLAAVDPERGKFRWFLLAAIKRFLLNEREQACAIKRGGAIPHVPFDGEKAEERYRLDASDTDSPDRLFDRAWATNQIEASYQRLQEEYALEGKGTLFNRVRIFLSGDKAELTYAEVGAGLQMTEGAVKVVVHRLRRRYRELLREQVAHTVHTPAELEEELRNLQLVFSRGA